MTVVDVRAAMRHYFAVLGTDRLVDALAPDVSWTILDTGEIVRGADEVRRHLDALHGAMSDVRNRELVIGEHAAFLEGECLVADARARIPYGVVYDVRDDRVAAMRLHGPLERAVSGD